MSLSSGIDIFINSLVSVFSNNENTPDTAASGIGDASYSWAQMGVPMTTDTGSPPSKGLAAGQTVVNFATSSPGVITADGQGGIDSSSPGPGLSSAKSDLISELEALFELPGPDPEGNPQSKTSQEVADGFANALLNFFSKAKVLTAINGVMPIGVAVPGPSGPVGIGTYTASGTGGIDSSSPGPGLSSALTSFKNALKDVFILPEPPPDSNPISKSVSEIASEIADACEEFFSSAMISTTNSGTAGGGPATVAVPPSPSAGTGITGTDGSPIISGSSTIGTIT
jgi:hypothetical protein